MPITAILAGGLATRLGPLTTSTSKSMLPIAGEPFIAHQLRLLVRQEFRHVVMCVGHFAEAITEFVGDGSRFGCEVFYSLDGDSPLDTGGALRRALPLLGDKFLVMYGDSYLRQPLLPVWESFVKSRMPALMTVFRNEHQWDASNVEFADGRILRYDKGRSGVEGTTLRHIDYGLGCVQSAALAEWPLGRRFGLGEFYQAMLRRKQLAAFEVSDRFYEIGSPGGLAATEELLTRRAVEEME